MNKSLLMFLMVILSLHQASSVLVGKNSILTGSESSPSNLYTSLDFTGTSGLSDGIDNTSVGAAPNNVIGVNVTGTSTKTILITLEDGSNKTGTFTDEQGNGAESDPLAMGNITLYNTTWSLDRNDWATNQTNYDNQSISWSKSMNGTLAKTTDLSLYLLSNNFTTQNTSLWDAIGLRALTTDLSSYIPFIGANTNISLNNATINNTGGINIIKTSNNIQQAFNLTNAGAFATAGMSISWINTAGNFIHAVIKSIVGAGYTDSVLIFQTANPSKVLTDRMNITANGSIGFYKGNLTDVGNITLTTGSYYYGDGSKLTNLPAGTESDPYWSGNFTTQDSNDASWTKSMNGTLAKTTDITGFITNATMNKSVACSSIIGGSDGDYCSDATGAGGGLARWTNITTVAYTTISSQIFEQIVGLNNTIPSSQPHKFYCNIVFSTNTTTTGIVFIMNASANISHIRYRVGLPIAADGVASEFQGYGTFVGDAVNSTAVAVIHTNYTAIIEGVVNHSASFTIQPAFKSEVASSRVNVSSTSFCEWERLL